MMQDGAFPDCGWVFLSERRILLESCVLGAWRKTRLAIHMFVLRRRHTSRRGDLPPPLGAATSNRETLLLECDAGCCVEMRTIKLGKKETTIMKSHPHLFTGTRGHGGQHGRG